MLRKQAYLILTIALTIVVSMVFMGKLWLSPDSYLFGAHGDGLQTYYQSIWHVKQDSSFLHQESVNYPFGESIFFTGGQPLVSNVVKVLKPVVDLSDHMVGITNWMMLSGVLICAVFLYLILKDRKVPPVYAALFAVGITFFSQQWERFGGHYPLAFLYAVPGMIYLLMRFYTSGKWKWSWLIAAYVLFLLFAHLYYLVFFAAIAAAFWLIMVPLNKERLLTVPVSFLHLAIQIVLPFFILQSLVSLSSDVMDRTAIPWGFIVFRSTWPSYLFPYGMWYEPLVKAFHPKSSPEWEGMAYIGATAYIFILAVVIASVMRFKAMYRQTSRIENKMMLSIALASVFCIAASFAFPFNIGFEKLLYKLGPVQQFRGIGRFAFVAFYLIQILAISLFFRISFSKTAYSHVIAAAGLMLMYSEGYSRISRVAEQITNERGDRLHADSANGELPDGMEQYQAILPMPFIHVGSENLWLTGKDGMMNEVYELSLKTGLPTFACMASRTSVSQTYELATLTLEPLAEPSILNKLGSGPVLLCADTSLLRPHEKLLVAEAEYLRDWRGLQLYRWSPASFASYAEKFKTTLIESCTIQADSIPAFQPRCLYDNRDTVFTLTGEWQTYRKEEIPPAWRGQKSVVSFWVKDFKRDLIARTTLELVQKRGDEVVQYDAEIIGKRLITFLGDDALIEYPIRLKEDAEMLYLTWENKLIAGTEMRLSHFLFRPESNPCCIFDSSIAYFNNRRFP